MDLYLLLNHEIPSNTTTPVDLSVIRPIIMFISTVRVSLYTTCAILTAKSDNFYHWFAPLFTGEAGGQTLYLIYEFLLHYYREWLSESFCNFLVHEQHFLSSSMIFLYVFAIFYFLFQENEYKVHTFAFFIFSFFMVIALAGSIVDSVFKEQSVCETRLFTGFAFAYMFAAAITVLLTMLVLIGWYACANHTDNSEQRTWFLVLFTAVAVRLIGLDVFTLYTITHLPIYFRGITFAVPLLYPIVFLSVAKGKLITRYRILSGSEID